MAASRPSTVPSGDADEADAIHFADLVLALAGLLDQLGDRAPAVDDLRIEPGQQQRVEIREGGVIDAAGLVGVQQRLDDRQRQETFFLQALDRLHAHHMILRVARRVAAGALRLGQQALADIEADGLPPHTGSLFKLPHAHGLPRFLIIT